MKSSGRPMSLFAQTAISGWRRLFRRQTSMDVIGLVELMQEVAPAARMRDDTGEANQRLAELGLSLDPTTEYFLLQYRGPFGSPNTEYELLDLNGENNYSLFDAATLCRDLLKIPPEFLPISTVVRNTLLMLNTETNEVFCVDFRGGAENFLGQRMESLGEFPVFLEDFLAATSQKYVRR